MTAASVVGNAAFVNLLVNAGDTPTPCQLGHPGSDVSDPNLLNFDAVATLSNLTAAGYGQSLEAQVLSAGLIGRAFDIQAVNTPDFINNFFAAKVEETNPFFYCVGVGCPCGNDALSPVAGCTNSMGDGAILSSTGSLSVGSDDFILTMTQARPDSFAVLFIGNSSTLCSVWGDGLLAVQPGPPGAFMFLGVKDTGPIGTVTTGAGLIAQAQGLYGSAGAILPGSTWYFQGYYRDALGGSPCSQNFNLSNGIGATFSN